MGAFATTITRADAVYLLSLLAPSSASSYVEGLASDARAGRSVIPWYTTDGCEVGAFMRGKRVRFYVKGNAHDGSDVRACLARLGGRDDTSEGRAHSLEREDPS
jgi:hypothetical protein